MDRKGKYVDAFVVPVPRKSLETYREQAEAAGRVWKEYGAIEFVEWIADDVKPGKVTSFPQAVNLEDDEVVAFSWILYESREHRDRVDAAVMNDPRIKGMGKMPFDGMRMFWGGFSMLLAM
jgi:uncharacterized protein YbaA (DUF1428 family)